MREIKFRLPIICNNCKTKGFQYFEWNGQQFIESNYDKCECHNHKLEINGEIQQYTGLKDKDGKEIFESDILNHMGKLFDVRFINNGFWITDNLGNEHMPYIEYREVCGNIHQNTKLIE